MFYLILEERVVDKHPATFPVAPTMEWAESNEDYEVGHTSYINGEFIPDPIPVVPIPTQSLDTETSLFLLKLSDPTTPADQVEKAKLMVEWNKRVPPR